MNAMRRGGGVAAALVGVLVTAGCGAAERGGGTGPTAAGGRSATAAAGQREVAVNRSYWYGGFKVTLGTARLSSAGSGGGVVTIDATFQNLGQDGDAKPTEDLLLTSGAESYDESDERADLPRVPAQRSRTGVIAIKVDDRFTFAEAVLTVGEPKSRQAVVPLARTDGSITLEPRPITVQGRAYPEGRKDVYMTLTGGEVRADAPVIHGQAPAGQEYVMISFTATNEGPAGMTYVFDRELNLVLPDGTKVGDAGSCSRAQVQVQPHATVRPEGPACFAIRAPAAGAYRFVWDNKDNAGVRFTIG